MKKLSLLFFSFIYVAATHLFAAKVDTVQTFSKTMNKEIPAIVVTPDSYTQETNLPWCIYCTVIVVTMLVLWNSQR